MKKLFILLILSTFIMQEQNAQTIENEKDSISYAMGVLLMENLKSQGVTEINAEMATKGITDAMKGGELLMSPQAASQVLQAYIQKNQEKAGKDFLVQNGKKEGIITLPSGLQYEVVTEGKGPKPTKSDRVTVHYEGTLINGDVFDSSYKRGEPATFGVTQVIAGWTEALQLMSVGSKWRLYIPHELAYGSRAMQTIPAYSTLIFDVELLGIE
ncbi:MAG: FKBP-type peptidyl-prolyl cis-trans isomerase [Saprospiraceae bacterium]